MASVIASIAAVCVMTGGIGYQAAVSGAQTDSTESSVKDQNTDQQESTDGSFSEEGTTQIGTVSQMPEFTVNAVTMTVEAVYASSGDTVSKGDALFKLTDESMEAAKSYYEDAIIKVLRSFGIEISSIKASVGPTITLYELYDCKMGTGRVGMCTGGTGENFS